MSLDSGLKGGKYFLKRICNEDRRRRKPDKGAEKGVAGHGSMMKWGVLANPSARRRPAEAALSGIAADISCWNRV
jgi:hypothetical protein